MRKEIIALQHIGIEGPGTMGDFFNSTAWRLLILDVSNGDALPENLEDIQAVISLGGPMNVYEEDKYPFLKDEDDFLRKAVREEIPVLGICLGAQLLAKACGAKVRKASVEEIGWKKVNLTEAARGDPLFQGLYSPLNVFQWHQDSFEIPEGGLHLAESQACRNQAFRFGRNAYGLQFHMEVTTEMLESWIDAYTKKDSKERNQEDMLIESYKRKETFRRQADMMYLNFSRIISSSQNRGKG